MTSSNLPLDSVRDAKARGANSAQSFVVQATPRDIEQLNQESPHGFLFVYRDSCPFCRALRTTVADLLLAMHDADLSPQQARLYFLDTDKHGEYGRNTLGVRSVPTVFLVDQGGVRPWPDADKVVTTRTDGAIVKTLPIDAMMQTLRALARAKRLRDAASTARQRQ